MGGIFEISDLKGDLKNNYTKQEVINYNAYGIIHKCKESKTNKMVAIKIINKKYLERICGNKNLEDCYENVRHEINCLKEMDGENSLHLIEDTETNDFFYLVMDLWDSNLEQLLKEKKTGLGIDEIKIIFQKLNIAFKRMFDKNIIHGNLKLENILIKYDNGLNTPFLSDYGKKTILDDRLNIMQSTTHYSAPELLIGDDYDYKVDLWSIGVILYKLFFNEFPFNGDTQVAIFNDIRNNKNLKQSGNALFDDLIKKLLIFDSNYRMTWEKYFSHKFWKNAEKEKEKLKTSNENNIYEEVEISDNDSNASSDSQGWKRESKYKSQKLKKHSYKTFPIFYCVSSSTNKNNNKNNNPKNENNEANNYIFKDLKKLEIEVENNKIEEPLDNLIYKEILKKIKLDNLTKLILYGCNLTSIDILTKLNPNNLLELDLSHNNINTLDNISETYFDKLITLNLSYNKISNLESLVDAPFIHLKNLNLSYNILYDIESLSLVPFNALDKLKLSGNKIRDISALTKVPFINCTYLELKNNKISDIENSLGFISITNLLYLDLSYNLIKSIEGLNVTQFQNLITLNLGNNQISNIDLLKEVYFSNLSKLDLFDNNIEDIKVFAEVPFKKLKELNLSYNKIKNIDFNFMIFENLSKINLNGNEINDLKNINLSNGLKELQLKNNKLKERKENENLLGNIIKKYKNLNLIYK